MFAAGGGQESTGEHGAFKPEIQEAGAGNFHILAHIADVELGKHAGGKLAGIHFSRLGQRHQRVALIIAEFRIGARTDENSGGSGIRQDRADSLLQFQLDLFMRQHGNDLTTEERDGHG